MTLITLTLLDGKSSSISDVIFSPDGLRVLAAGGRQIFIYSAVDGTLVQALSGHKELVTCLAYARDGKRYASGSLDKSVIIWSNSNAGLLKFQ